jgi:coatomer subunit beta
VLDRVDQLRKRNEGVLDDLTMEILRVLSSPDIDVRKKALELALQMVSSKNVQEVVMLLKKELTKTVDEQYEKVIHSMVEFNVSANIPRITNIANFLFTPFINVP